jgi:hypothetical protein
MTSQHIFDKSNMMGDTSGAGMMGDASGAGMMG